MTSLYSLFTLKHMISRNHTGVVVSCLCNYINCKSPLPQPIINGRGCTGRSTRELSPWLPMFSSCRRRRAMMQRNDRGRQPTTDTVTARGERAHFAKAPPRTRIFTRNSFFVGSPPPVSENAAAFVHVTVDYVRQARRKR
jgi:hypothetical protein